MVLTSIDQQIFLTLNILSFWLQQSDSESECTSLAARAKICEKKKINKINDLDSEFKVYSSIIKVVKYIEKY